MDSVVNASRSLTSACSSKASLSAAALRSPSSSAATWACARFSAVASRWVASSVRSRCCRSVSSWPTRFDDSSSRARAAATSATGRAVASAISRALRARITTQQRPAPINTPTANPAARDMESIDRSKCSGTSWRAGSKRTRPTRRPKLVTRILSEGRFCHNSVGEGLEAPPRQSGNAAQVFFVTVSGT